MKEFFEQYGGVVITATAIIAIVAIIGLLAVANANGVIYSAFQGLIDSFVSKTALCRLPAAFGGIMPGNLMFGL